MPDMPDIPANRLAQQQRAFAGFLRQPGQVEPPPGMEPTRLAMLQQMVANDFSTLVSSCFPNCACLLGQARWASLVHRYFTGHRCRTPLFTEIAGEFVRWLRASDTLPHPALGELAHLEWTMARLHQLDAAPLPQVDDFDPLDTPLRRSPLAWPLQYQWPVHDLGLLAGGAAPPTEPIAFLAQRDERGNVRMATLGLSAAWLLLDIGTEPGLHGRQYVLRLAAHYRADADELAGPVQVLLQQAIAQRIIGPSCMR